jgi:hypothetical protein
MAGKLKSIAMPQRTLDKFNFPKAENAKFTPEQGLLARRSDECSSRLARLTASTSGTVSLQRSVSRR